MPISNCFISFKKAQRNKESQKVGFAYLKY